MNDLWNTLLQWLHRVGLHPDRTAVEQAGGAVLDSASAAAAGVGQAVGSMDMASLLALGFVGPVRADIFKCTDDAGHITYANAPGKGCKRIITDPTNSAPSGGSRAPAKVSTPSPSDFPKVGSETQRPFASVIVGGMLVLPMVIIFGAFLYLLPRIQSGAGSFGKLRDRSRIEGDKPNITFADVAGEDEAVAELREITEFLTNPERFHALGASIPRGVLLYGPPGTGKTLLARAVAGEAGVPFYSISASEFVEMYVGVGASRVRKLFDQAKQHAPAIVFVDEIDAVGRGRGIGTGGGNDEREQTLNQLLVELDGFDARTNVILVAATNRPDVLDRLD